MNRTPCTPCLMQRAVLLRLDASLYQRVEIELVAKAVFEFLQQFLSPALHPQRVVEQDQRIALHGAFGAEVQQDQRLHLFAHAAPSCVLGEAAHLIGEFVLKFNLLGGGIHVIFLL